MRRAITVGEVIARAGLEVSADERQAGPCPACGAGQRGSHDDRLPIGIRADGLGWQCQACKAKGSGMALASWIVAGCALPKAHPRWREVLAWCDDGEAAAPRATAAPRPAAPPRRPSEDELAPVISGEDADVDAAQRVDAWLSSRGIEVDQVAELGLVRPLVDGAPDWARGPAGSWAVTGHVALVALYDAHGKPVSVRARATSANARPKSLTPRGYEVAGLVMACPIGQAMLRGDDGDLPGVIVCEGEPDWLTWATAGTGCAVFGIESGAWTADIAARVPDGAVVCVRTHRDAAGREYAARVARTLHPRCAVLVYPPGDPDEKADENDLLRSARLPELPSDGLVPWEPPSAPDSTTGPVECQESPPLIVAGLNRKAAVVAALPALDAAGYLVRGGQLVRVVEGELAVDDRDAFAARLSELVQYARVNKDGDVVPCQPPTDVVRALFAWGEWGLGVIETVARAPFLRCDGSLVVSPGFDRPSRTWLELDGDWPPVPEHPTKAEATTAWERILEPTCDVPFCGPEDRAAWGALVLALLARPGLTGPAPMFAIDAPSRGTGKTLLADLAHVIAFGTPVRTQDPWCLARDDELAKVVLSAGIRGAACILFDNVDKVLANNTLNAVLTSRVYEGRVLGSSTMASVRPPVFVVTGNNLAIKGDLTRRTVALRIDAAAERPALRTGWRYPDVRGWALAHRRELVAAGLTVLRWGRLESPAGALPAMGSYEAWSDVVRAPIHALTGIDVLTSRDALEAEDEEHDALSQLLAAWWEAWGNMEVSTKTLMSDDLGRDGPAAQVLAAVRKLSGSSHPGYVLRSLRDRPAGGYVLRQSRHNRARAWRCEQRQ